MFRTQHFFDYDTECYNKNYLYSNLDRLLNEAQKAERNIFLISFCIDYFSSIKAKYEAKVVKDIINAFARRIRNNIRPLDICVYFSEAHFVLILYADGIYSANSVAHRLRSILIGMPFDVKEIKPHYIQCSVSINIIDANNPSTASQVLKQLEEYKDIME